MLAQMHLPSAQRMLMPDHCINYFIIKWHHIILNLSQIFKERKKLLETLTQMHLSGAKRMLWTDHCVDCFSIQWPHVITL